MIAKNRRLTLIVGPYGAGKTTYLHTLSNCLRLDFDEILDTLHGPPRKYYNACRLVAEAMYWAGFERALATGANIAVTTTSPTAAARARFVTAARRSGYAVRIVCLAVDYETALQRCKKDPARPKTTRWHELLANWYRDYEPVAAAEADEMEIINAKH